MQQTLKTAVIEMRLQSLVMNWYMRTRARLAQWAETASVASTARRTCQSRRSHKQCTMLWTNSRCRMIIKMITVKPWMLISKIKHLFRINYHRIVRLMSNRVLRGLVWLKLDRMKTWLSPKISPSMRRRRSTIIQMVIQRWNLRKRSWWHLIK